MLGHEKFFCLAIRQLYFSCIRVQWVLPKNVVSILSAWWNWLGSHTSNVWNMVPACLMWLIWKERNAQIFEETERLVDCVKSLLLRTLIEWSCIWGFTHCHSLFKFLNSVSLSFWLVCILFCAVSLLL